MAVNGMHHAAFMTNDMKAQIEFYTQVVGLKLVGIFPMHGVEGASHCFLDAGNGFLLSFVQIKGREVEPVYGVSHARDVSDPAAGGAIQHIALTVDTMEEMLALRDRLRSSGYAVFGPLDHGLSRSMYLGSPEGIHLEFATPDTCEPMKAEDWIIPETAASLGMSEDDLKRYTNPPAFQDKGGSVPQPPLEAAVYPTPIPRPMFDQLGYLNDADLEEALRFPAPSEVAE